MDSSTKINLRTRQSVDKGGQAAGRIPRRPPRHFLPPEIILAQLDKDVQIDKGTLAQLKTWLASEDARYIAKAMLVLLAGGAFAAAAIVAPGGTSAIAQLIRPLLHERRHRPNRVTRHLQRLKLVKVIVQPDGSGRVELTKRGRQMALRAHLDALALERPKKWDKLWRMVIFDIPERHRVARDVLRAKLRQLGFIPIQQSVWLFPWPCEAELQLLRERFGLGSCMLILTIADSPEFKNFKDNFFRRN